MRQTFIWQNNLTSSNIKHVWLLWLESMHIWTQWSSWSYLATKIKEEKALISKFHLFCVWSWVFSQSAEIFKSLLMCSQFYIFVCWTVNMWDILLKRHRGKVYFQIWFQTGIPLKDGLLSVWLTNIIILDEDTLLYRRTIFLANGHCPWKSLGFSVLHISSSSYWGTCWTWSVLCHTHVPSTSLLLNE